MLNSLALSAINHLLRQAPTVLARLSKFSGSIIQVCVGPISCNVEIGHNGELTHCKEHDNADLNITLSLFSLPLLWSRSTLLKHAKVSGDPALANEIAFIFNNINWDAEEDLSKLFGDIMAHRIVTTGRSLIDWRKYASTSLQRSLAEYWTEERAVITTRARATQFIDAIDDLRDSVARIEKRLDKLSTQIVLPN